MSTESASFGNKEDTAQAATPPSNTDRVIDAAATIGRVQSYFSIAGSTIVLTISYKGAVRRPANNFSFTSSIGFWLLVRKRRLVATLRVAAIGSMSRREYNLGCGYRRTCLHRELVATSFIMEWLLLLQMGKIALSAQATFSAEKSPAMQVKFTIEEENMEFTKAFTVSRTVVTTTDGNETKTRVDPLGYQNGQRVQLWYDPADGLHSASLSDDDWRRVGAIVLLLSLLLLVAAWAWFWATLRYKPLAALQGGTTAVSMLTGAFTRP
jgi:hypothetical protein